MVRLFLTGILVIATMLSASARRKHTPPTSQHPFQAGESIEYSAYYNWGFLWIDAADVRFTVKDTTIGKTNYYSFYSEGISHSDYDWIFKVRDYYESIASKEDLSPLSFTRNTYEGGYKVNNQYRFLGKQVFMSIENSDLPMMLDTIETEQKTFDLLTAIYYARTINYSKLKIDQKVPIKVISDGTAYNLYFRYKGIEEIKTRETHDRYKCAKFTVLLIEGTIFNEGEDMTIWVTDDDARVPVKVEAQILIGSVTAILSNIQGNKFPLTGKLPALE